MHMIFFIYSVIKDFGALKLICYFDVEGFELKGPGKHQKQHDHGHAQEVLHSKNYTHGTYYTWQIP